MSSAVCFDLDLSTILSSGNGLRPKWLTKLLKNSETVKHHMAV